MIASRVPLCWIVLVTSAIFLISCSSLPVIKPVERTDTALERCRAPYPFAPYRFVHAIEATLPGGGRGTMMGVALVDPLSRVISSAIMTIEGFVLFEAVYNKELTVQRALPPFNAEHFAEYLMRDIRLIYLAPEGFPSAVGTLENGSTICRYGSTGGEIMDMVVHRDDSWEIATYRNGSERLRRVRAFSLRNGIPEVMELTGYGAGPYALRLTLLSAEEVPPEEVRGVVQEKKDDK